MKHKFSAIVAVVISICGGIALLVSPAVYASGTATLTFSPATGSYLKGKTISVRVYEDSGGDSVNAVQANIAYNTAQLKYLSFSDSSAMNIEAENPSGNTGNLHFARGSITPVTGTQAVVTVNFSVVSGSGTAGLDFASGSAVVRSTDNGAENLTLGVGKYTLTSPVSPPPPPPSPAPTPNPTPSPSPTTVTYVFVPPSPSTIKPGSSSSPNAASKLKITDVQSSNSGDGGSTVITWTTNERTTSTVLYGSDKSHLVSKSDGSLVTEHSVTIPSDELKSGSTYYFYVSSTDTSGNTVSSQLLPFIAAGNTVSSSSSKLNKQIFTIVGIGAVILAAILVLFGFYKLQQSIQEQRELRTHFPDMPTNGQPPAASGGVVTFNPPGTPQDDHQHPQQSPGQNGQANKIR